ncbi:Protein of unknown function [Tenacibaculum litopenaei]|uniref:hypothetical protein n=1 Tax=Tenacibaculum litopenaei TaxID=396016 RepID=UPI00389552BB
MKVQSNEENGKYVAAFSNEVHGFEFIYVKCSNSITFLFENRLAANGVWLNDKQVSEMVQPIIDGDFRYNDGSSLISLGDEILIDSYKYRGMAFCDENGLIYKQNPDFTRSLKIVNQ